MLGGHATVDNYQDALEPVIVAERHDNVHVDAVETIVRSNELSRKVINMPRHPRPVAVNTVPAPGSDLLVHVWPSVPPTYETVSHFGARMSCVTEQLKHPYVQREGNIRTNLLVADIAYQCGMSRSPLHLFR